jgi:hypothetical protein
MKMIQRRRQRRVKQAIDNTKRCKALAEAERTRQRVLQNEINAKKELKTLKAKTRQLKEKRGSVDLRKGAKTAGKILKTTGKMLNSVDRMLQKI